MAAAAGPGGRPGAGGRGLTRRESVSPKDPAVAAASSLSTDYISAATAGTSEWKAIISRLLDQVSRVRRGLDVKGLARPKTPAEAGEVVLQLCQKAVEHIPRSTQEWKEDDIARRLCGRALDSLGTAFAERVLGIRDRNLEHAVRIFEQAVRCYPRESSPAEWASTLSNLGVALSNRTGGNRVEHIDHAIACFEHALEVLRPEKNPYEWAMAMVNVAAAHIERPTGNRSDNIDRAIVCLNKALLILKREKHPEDWAIAKMNLGNAVRERYDGSRNDNIETLIRCYENALEVLTAEKHPDEYTTLQLNLGMAFTHRLQGSSSANARQAIKCFSEAAKSIKKDSDAGRFALLKLHDGISHWRMHLGDDSDSTTSAGSSSAAIEELELATKSLEACLEIFSRETAPMRWATAQTWLGHVLRDKAVLKKSKGFSKAIECYERARQVATPSVMPVTFAVATECLADLLVQAGKYKEAVFLSTASVESLGILLRLSRTGGAAFDRLNKASLWHAMVRTSVIFFEMRRFDEAFKYATMAKAFRLYQLTLLERPSDEDSVDVPEDIVREQNLLEMEAINGVCPERPENTSSSGEFLSKLDEHFAGKDAAYAHVLEMWNAVKEMRTSDLKSSLAETVMIDWLFFEDSLLTFQVSLESITCERSKIDMAKVRSACNSILTHANTQVTNSCDPAELLTALRKLAQLLELDDVMHTLATRRVPSVILVPHDALCGIPLHALTDARGRTLYDILSQGVRYWPHGALYALPTRADMNPEYSLRMNQFCPAAIVSHSVPGTSGALQDQLLVGILEGLANNAGLDGDDADVRSLNTRSKEDPATRDSVVNVVGNRRYVHFTSPLKYVRDRPLESGLQFAKDTMATAQDLMIGGVSLGECSFMSLLPYSFVGTDNPGEVATATQDFASSAVYSMPGVVMTCMWKLPEAKLHAVLKRMIKLFLVRC
jgi:tetratricopeptide (TPR) repeat protein